MIVKKSKQKKTPVLQEERPEKQEPQEPKKTLPPKALLYTEKEKSEIAMLNKLMSL